MPISFSSRAGGTGYIDIRATDDGHGIGQGLIDVDTLGAYDDADGVLPPGLPLLATGGPVTAGSAYGIIGPEPVKMGAVDHFGNMILTGVLNRDAIEANLGRALTAAELSGIATGMPQIRLI
jgi:hypothetical protein